MRNVRDRFGVEGGDFALVQFEEGQNGNVYFHSELENEQHPSGEWLPARFACGRRAEQGAVTALVLGLADSIRAWAVTRLTVTRRQPVSTCMLPKGRKQGSVVAGVAESSAQRPQQHFHEEHPAGSDAN